MSEYRAQEEPSPLAPLARRVRRDPFFAGLAVLVLAHAGEASAGEPASLAAGRDRGPASDMLRASSSDFSIFSSSAFAFPDKYALSHDPETAAFSAIYFRPRAAAQKDSEGAPTVTDESLMRETTVWQRLADFRALGRVRVLTLWQAGSTSVSLQAGRKGSPSLQWTAKLFDRSPGSSGLFDRLPSVSSIAAGRELRGAAHPATPVLAVKSNAPPSPARPAIVTPP